MENQSQIHALGTERLSKLLWKFSLPCVMGLLISAFYNIVDQIFIGNSELGYLGNAATGISFGNELYQEFAIKTFRIYLSLTMINCLVKLTSVFFQAIGKPVYAFVSSLVRDILCFTPLALILPSLFEKAEPGSGINGILFAVPISDLIALVVIVLLTTSFFRKLKK